MSKEDYIEAIKALLQQTSDMQLVDYIYKLLEKCA